MWFETSMQTFNLNELYDNFITLAKYFFSFRQQGQTDASTSIIQQNKWHYLNLMKKFKELEYEIPIQIFKVW